MFCPRCECFDEISWAPVVIACRLGCMEIGDFEIRPRGYVMLHITWDEYPGHLFPSNGGTRNGNDGLGQVSLKYFTRRTDRRFPFDGPDMSGKVCMV